MLGELLINKACILRDLGESEAALKAAVRSYYVLDSMDLKKDADEVKSYLKDTYGYESC